MCVMMASNVNKQLSLSSSKVQKACEAIDFLSTLSSSAGPSGLSSHSEEKNKKGVFTWNAFTFTAIGISEAADKALGMLKCMKAEKSASKKRVRTELSHLFKKKAEPAWRHKLCCLAYHDQERIPATDVEKEELYQVGLGERVSVHRGHT